MGFTSVATASFAALCALLAPHAVLADQPWSKDLKSYQEGNRGQKPVQHFFSSNVVAPVYQVNTFDVSKVDTSEPYMFMCGNYGGWGPSIVSSKDLSLVFSHQVYGGLAQTARSWENFKGQRVMSVYVDGAVRIFNQDYEQIYAVVPQGSLKGVYPDSHEAMLTDDDTALLIACPATPVDLTSVGGPASGKQVSNCHVQEIDPDTNEVLFQFATLDYFSVDDTYWKYNNEDNWDFCHMNAVQKTPEGNFLISYRHLSTVILVDGKTQKVIWQMWGKKNMFTDISEWGSAKFHWQHEPRVTGPNRFSLFDNHRLDNGFCKEGECSRGLEVEYDSEKLTVRMVNQWLHPQSLVSASRGGVQKLPNGNVAVAWGQNPMYTEYTADGELAMDVQRGQVLTIEHGFFDVITYRIWKGQWDGNPGWGPNVSANKDDNGQHIYVSWNGATKVDQWALMLSDSKNRLDGGEGVEAWSDRMGFETQFNLAQTKKYARVAAVDMEGKVIGATPVVRISNGELYEVEYDVKPISNPDKVPADDGEDEDENDEEDDIVDDTPEHDSDTGNDTPQDDGQQDDSHDDSHDDNNMDDHKTAASPFVVGLGGIVFLCVGLSIAMLFFWRRRRAHRGLAVGGKGDESEAQYGLLMSEGLDGNDGERESFEDDKDVQAASKPHQR